MKNFKKYLSFCHKFQNHSFPKLKFKPLNEQYRILYREFYNIDEEDINKASFFVFLFCFFIILAISVIILSLNIIFIILSSLIFSLIFSYKFNSVIYHDIKKIEAEINAMLYLIKIDFSIIQKTLKPNSDYHYNFIKLINEYNIPFLSNFKEILKNIHEGALPENEIKNSLEELFEREYDLSALHVENITAKESLKNVLFVPLLMFPLLFLVYLVILRIRQQ